MDKSINYYLICLMLFCWHCLLFGADQESLGKNHWLTLPTEIHQKIAQFFLEDDMASFAPHAGDFHEEQEKIHFRLYDHFIKKGFFPNTLHTKYLDPQMLNNFRFVSKDFFALVNNISYESKLTLWYEKRIVLFIDSEEKLFNRLLEITKNDKILIISRALNFFRHDKIQRSISYRQRSNKGFFQLPLPAYRKNSVLYDFPFVAVIFYANALILKVQNNKCTTDIEQIITQSSLLQYTTHCNFEWLKKFIFLSLHLLKKNISKELFTHQKQLEEFIPLEKFFLQSEIKIFTEKELILSIIDHYSILTINSCPSFFASYDKNWLKKLSSEEQKIIWFYCVNVLQKEYNSKDNYPCFHFPELLVEIKEWLQVKYLINTDLKIICVRQDLFKVIALVGYLLNNAVTENVFDGNLFFKVLTFILNLKNPFNDALQSILPKYHQIRFWDDAFYQLCAEYFFEEYNKNHNTSGQKSINNESEVVEVNGSEQKDLNNKSRNPSVIKNVTSDENLSKGKQSTSEDKTRRRCLKRIVLYCVASVIACVSLYNLWYHVKNYKHHYIKLFVFGQ